MGVVRGFVAGLFGLISAAAWAGGPRLVTLQDDGSGGVDDCYIWQESPDYNGNSDTLYVGLVGTTDKMTFIRFDVSALAGLTVVEARLVLQVMGTSGQAIRVHRVTAPWAETEPTWATFSTNYEATPVTSFTPAAGRVTVDLTTLAQQWVSGATNNGFALVQDTLTSPTTFYSSDHATLSLRPALELLVEDPVVPGPLVTGDVPPLEASCSVAFRYPLAAYAPDATSFTLSSGSGPSLDASTGELTWTPERGDRGTHEWVVTASDGQRTDTLTVSIEVACTQQPLTVGCTAVPGGLAWALGGLALALRRRRAR